jgi:hypothetical protein
MVGSTPWRHRSVSASIILPLGKAAVIVAAVGHERPCVVRYVHSHRVGRRNL